MSERSERWPERPGRRPGADDMSERSEGGPSGPAAGPERET